jgi:hypothetical protein
MQKLIMEEASIFQHKVEEINRVLKDGWDIYEGPFVVGHYICLKLIKHGSTKLEGNLPDVPSGLIKFEDDDQDF